MDLLCKFRSLPFFIFGVVEFLSPFVSECGLFLQLLMPFFAFFRTMFVELFSNPDMYEVVYH